MTFSIVLIEPDQFKRIVGTLWASDEADAKAIAPALIGNGNFRVERAEEREIPLKISEGFGRGY